MATLYWGGGTGSWDSWTSANWYSDFARTVLAGRAPSAEDDVIFDASSSGASYTVTLSGTSTTDAVCRSCTISGPASGTMTLAGSRWNIYGDLTFPATGLTRTFTGTLTFYGEGSRTITTNGVTFSSNTIFAGAGTYTLQDALSTNQFSVIINSGTLNTDGKALTCGTIGGYGTGTLTLGASTVTTASIDAGILTINAGTSTINLTSASNPNLGGTGFAGATFYNVSFTSSSFSGTFFTGSYTFNNLSFAARTAPAVVSLGGDITVNGTLTISGGSATQRVWMFSDIDGVARTVTVAAVSALADVDFTDIVVAGASAPWSGTRLGNAKGNSNITFAAGANKYIATGTTSSNWTDVIWATTSGGSAAANNYPLAQDSVIIDDAGMNTGATLTMPGGNILFASLDFGGRTNAITISALKGRFLNGDLTLSSAVTVASPSSVSFAGRTAQNITTAGKTLAQVFLQSPSGSLTLMDDLNTGTNAIWVSAGQFNANNKNITCDTLYASGDATKTITLGSGTITTTRGVQSSGIAAPNTTLEANTATILISGPAALGFPGQATSFGGNVSATGISQGMSTYGDVTVGNLTLTAPTGTSATSKLTLGGSLTVTGTLALAGGTSVTQRAFVRSGTIGTQRTLSAATVTGLTDIDFRGINATGAANWTSGTRLGDCGGNAGITFPAAKTVYWNLAGAQNWSATAWATSSGGTPAANNFPLAQDTAVFDDTGSAGTVTLQAFNIGTLSAGSRTSAWTFAGTAAVSIYGDVTFGSGITASASSTCTFSGTGTQTFTTAGKSTQIAIWIDKPSGVFQHGDALTATSGGITINGGNYNTQNYNITCPQFVSNNSSALRSITLGTSTLTVSFGTNPFTLGPTNLTFSAASSTILLSGTGSKTFAGGGLVYGTLSSTGGTGVNNPLTITGSNTFSTLTNSAYTNLILTSGTTQTVTTMSYSGASGSLVRVHPSIPGQRARLNLPSNAIGANSVDTGNNVGFSFTGSSPNYLSLRDMQYVSPLVPGGFFMLF